MDRINQITQARHVIEQIMFTYAEGIDTGDIETVAQLFAQGAIVLPDGSEIKGYQEVYDQYTGMVMFYDDNEQLVPYKRHECSPRTRHVVTNLMFEFNNDVTVADVKSYFMVYQTMEGKNQVIAGGRYVDRFERTIHGWHLVTRTIHFDNMGDMSRHNTAFEET
jgi:3-phenylpropionate/cinnamic acid dioxygenase small subunit